DLLLGELVEGCAVLPNVNRLESVVGRGRPVEDRTWRCFASGLKAHLVEDLVVLLKRAALEVNAQSDCHRSSSGSSAVLTGSYQRESAPHDLDVLLRHRSRSISLRQHFP